MMSAVLLISICFFCKLLKGRYPVNYCDDGYIAVVSNAHGWWPRVWRQILLFLPLIHQYRGEHTYGYEH